MLKLFLLMTVVPILEIALLLHVHGQLGAWLGSGNALLITIGSVVITGILGSNLAKSQGFKAVQEIGQALSQGQVPASAMLDGLIIVVGGVLLITPGYATDFIGLLFLAPLSRDLIKGSLQRWLTHKVQTGSLQFTYYQRSQAPKQQSHQSQGSPIIDVDPISDRSD